LYRLSLRGPGSGIRTTLGIKIFGPDLEVIQRIGHDIEVALAGLRGTASIYAERSFGGRYLEIRPRAEALARYGLTTGAVQEVIATALGGDQITTTVEGRERFPVQVRYARDFRDSPETIGQLLVSGERGIQVPLAQVADIGFTAGPPMIRSENGYLNDLVSIDVRGRDVGGYVAEAKQVVAREVNIPPGYRLGWSGQYEAMQRVKSRLQVVVPLTIGVRDGGASGLDGGYTASTDGRDDGGASGSRVAHDGRDGRGHARDEHAARLCLDGIERLAAPGPGGAARDVGRATPEPHARARCTDAAHDGDAPGNDEDVGGTYV